MFVSKNTAQFKKTFVSIFAVATFGLGASALAEVNPDNTKVNAQPENHEMKTSQSQGNSEADINLTKTIRQNVVKQDKLSTNAKNVKIITMDGAVYLKGPVENQNEKKMIEDIARKAAGKKPVTSELTVLN
jgi:hyperosmotically inducible periplasmic protein